MRPSRAGMIVLLLLLAAAPAGAVSACGGSETESRSFTPEQIPPRDGRPNLIVVMTDDQTLSQFTRQTMPETFSRFVDQGAWFADGVAVPPLCCPARAGFVAGQYPQNHGVYDNQPGYADLVDPDNTIGPWMQRAGYRTAMIGKYVNRYENVEPERPGPGWDEWFAMTGTYAYWGFDINRNGSIERFEPEPEGYLSDVLTERAVEFIDENPPEQPFFMWLSHYAPHVQRSTGRYRAPLQNDCSHEDVKGAQPRTTADLDAVSGERVPRTEAFNEADVSDKQGDIAEMDRLSPEEVEIADRRWRCAVSSLGPVDEGIASVFEALDEAGELDRTVLAFISDNGFFHGEHRVQRGKSRHYDASVRVPLAVWAPEDMGWTSGERIGGLASNVDLAPTLLELARAEPCISDDECRRIDGRSLVSVLEGREPRWLEERAVPLALDSSCEYRGMRSLDWLYADLTSERCPGTELYDLADDPLHLNNLSGRPAHADTESALARRAAELNECSGVRGVDEPADDRPLCE